MMHAEQMKTVVEESSPFIPLDEKLSEMMKDVREDFNTDLIEVIMLWFNQYKMSHISHLYRDLDEIGMNDLWTNVWFAKEDSQKFMDKELKKFERFYEQYMNYEPKYLYEYIALIVLYDQVPRNIFRNSAKAYETDRKALDLARSLVPYMDKLPIQFNISIIMSFVHSEELEDLKQAKQFIEALEIKYAKYNVLKNLKLIFKNHNDRMELFGRIPERNKYLGRASTEMELTYLKNINSQ